MTNNNKRLLERIKNDKKEQERLEFTQHRLTKQEIANLSHEDKVRYYANSSDTPAANHGNGKTGPGCITISVPVEETCNHEAPCYVNKVCYACKGRQCFASVLGAYYRNWRLYKEDVKRYEDKLHLIISCSGLPLVRWNDAGDFANDDAYFQMTVNLALRNPSVKFLAYTKWYDLVNRWLDKGGTLPANYTVRFSMADKDWPVPNPHNLPLAFIDFSNKSLNPNIPRNAFHCKGNANPKDLEHSCTACQACWNKKVHSVVFAQH